MRQQRASWRFSRVTLVANLNYAGPALLDAADRVLPYLSGGNPFDILIATNEMVVVEEAARPNPLLQA